VSDSSTDWRPTEATPSWAATAGQGEAFARGVRAAFGIAGYVLIAGSIGFGALVRDLGLGIDFAILSSIVFYALPAQVILAAEVGRGAPLVAAAFAVTLTSVRLLPMAVTITPFLQDHKGRRWREVMAMHFVAVTAWIEANRRLGPLPPHLRLSHFIGFGFMFMMFTAVSAAVGFMIAGRVPVALTAALLFFTPAYFLLSMMQGAFQRADWLAIGLGAVIGPLVYLVSPDLDLLVAGLVGGTAAYVSGRWRR
jgi:predicted branched-subunit amino acid permease